ncbi:hypothetical protein C0J52_15885 [Blattella germanica]|nr:hypothetical protein C0J52_15885 [Blattella germanica]
MHVQYVSKPSSFDSYIIDEYDKYKIFLVIPITFYDKPNLNKGVVEDGIQREDKACQSAAIIQFPPPFPLPLQTPHHRQLWHPVKTHSRLTYIRIFGSGWILMLGMINN